LYTVWISIGAFEDLEDLRVICELADPIADIR
jgi:hypothetical protein